MKQAGKRARLGVALATAAAFLVSVAGASAGVNGGWDHVGDFKTPKAYSLNGAVYALSAESDNGLLVGGNFNFKTADGRPAAHLAVWYPTQFWSAYATPTPLNGDVHAIAWDYDHIKLYVGGQFTDAGGNATANFLAVWNGSNWAPFCGPLGGSVAALQIIGSTLYVGGAFQNGGGIHNANYLIACDLNTGVARPVGNVGDINGGVYALTPDANGTLYAGGQFINIAGIPQADHVAAFDGSWHAMGTGPSPGGGAVDDYVRSLTSSGNDVGRADRPGHRQVEADARPPRPLERQGRDHLHPDRRHRHEPVDDDRAEEALGLQKLPEKLQPGPQALLPAEHPDHDQAADRVRQDRARLRLQRVQVVGERLPLGGDLQADLLDGTVVSHDSATC